MTWIGGNLIVYGSGLAGSTTIDQLRTVVTINTIGDVTLIVAAILAILVVRRIQRREDARAVEMGRDPSAEG